MSTSCRQNRRQFLRWASGSAAAGALSGLFPQLSVINHAMAQSAATGYKALVCIFLEGGNDSWNMLIPNNPARHAEYLTARGGVYQGSAGALGIPISGGGGAQLPNALPLVGVEYALNPAMPELQTLFNQRKVSFLANVGQIVVPLRKSTIDNFVKPPELYSHNDQTRLWQSGSGTSTASANGWGGQMAARLLSVPPLNGLSPCISLSGQSRFLEGDYAGGSPVTPYRLSTNATQPATELGNYDPTFDFGAGAKRREILQRSTTQGYANNAMAQAYADILERSLRLSSSINSAAAALNSNSAFNSFNSALAAFPDSSIGRQLQQVARTIALSRFGQGSIQANRQVFYVSDGSYDTHGNQIPNSSPNAGVWDGHQGLLQDLSKGLSAFNNALTVLNSVPGFVGVVNEVVSFTASEFGRTLSSNSDGTDHAWGGVQLVMGASAANGGPLFGGEVIGRYPRIILNRSYPGSTPDVFGECFERGEFLPTIAVDQMAASLARWMGVSNNDLPALFPNIDNFVNAHPNAAVMAYNTRTVPVLNFT
jgi:uncharacterized protein (DUF1501 family)